MLQFTTSFTYFMLGKRRQELGAQAYCVHAIFAHGKDVERKKMSAPRPHARTRRASRACDD